MSEQRTALRVEHASSTGHAMAAADWLDLHFAACHPEYEATLRAVGIQPGWRVLDAGCGGGSFLPLLAGLVGPQGHIAALDLAPENVAAVRERAAAWRLPCPVEARVGDLAALPYPDGHFDAVWCANTLMYVPDAALPVALAELRRVVRPGGLVAVKDVDTSLHREPSPIPDLVLHLIRAWAGPGAFRGPELRGWLRRAGLTDVRLTTTLVERYAPLRPVERARLESLYAALAEAAAGGDLPEAERAEWARLGANHAALLDDPDCYHREGYVLAVGTVPCGAA